MAKAVNKKGRTHDERRSFINNRGDIRFRFGNLGLECENFVCPTMDFFDKDWERGPEGDKRMVVNPFILNLWDRMRYAEALWRRNGGDIMTNVCRFDGQGPESRKFWGCLRECAKMYYGKVDQLKEWKGGFPIPRVLAADGGLG